MIFHKALLIAMLTSLLGGCAFKFYDQDNPEEYEKYWRDENNRRESILYPLTVEGRGERKNDALKNR